MQAAVGVLLGDRDDQTQVRLGHFALGLPCLGLAGRHLLVDLLQILQGDHHPLLQVEQLLLLLDDGLAISGQALAVRMVRGDLAIDPAQARLVLGELLDEVRPRHAALVDDQVLNLALGLADVVDLATHAVAQTFDLARGEADLHQLGRDLLLQIEILLRPVAFLLQHHEHPGIKAADRPEALQRRDLEPLQVFGRDRTAVGFLFVEFLERVLVVHRLELLVEIHQPVDDVVDLEFVLFDLGCELEDLRDGHRAGRDRHDHVLQAFLDPLGDLDLALARQQLDRPHLAHIHAYRVGGAAEFRIKG